MEYISGLAEPAKGGCFLCEYRDRPTADAEQFVLWRRAASFVVLNRFPYTNGHTLIAPLAHGGGLGDHSESVLAELAIQIRDVQRVLEAILKPDGFNIGMNLGRCAGAGLPDHLHYHVVPRWNGDTNFMSIVGNARVIPQSLEQVRDKAIEEARRIEVVK